MSHFFVLVCADDESHLEKQLLPFYEYGCDSRLDKLVTPYLEFKSDDDGGYLYNPNAKWDWYTIGGRADNLIIPGNTALIRELDLGDIKAQNRKYAEDIWNEYEEIFSDEREALKHSAFFEFHVRPEDTREIYIEREGGALTWAIVTRDGRWIERAEMGWWGLYSNEHEDYNEKFWKELESLPKEQRIYIVDCHI
ncbi:MAG: hypothetical protein HXS54_06285 [Theionarchaea archaeon]|nr:hypothetical protein [Theionarchaea archaeon]DBA34867.1 TPA_asm: hypothetical protein vir521_00073 [Caudoviricetes sp. vir521]